MLQPGDAKYASNKSVMEAVETSFLLRSNGPRFATVDGGACDTSVV